MLVFVDDSGDPGFKVGKGSSKYFAISAVIFNDELEAEKVAVAIKEIRRDLGFSDLREFKFNKLKREYREAFLKKVKDFDFHIRSIVVDKTIIRSDELRNNKNSFYSYIIKMLLQYSNGEILNAKIRIDGSGDRTFKRNFLAYLKKELNSSQKQIVKNCKLIDSRNNVLIQLADMVAGSVRRSYDTQLTDYQIYKSIIRSRIQDEWLFQ